MVHLVWVIGAFVAPAVWLVLLATGHAHDFNAGTESLVAGISIVGAAFLLGWACELAEEDVPPAFALIVLALVAVLPEYAVDMHFAWKAAEDPTYLPYAVANMTGANRVLIGFGWSSLVFIWWAKRRQTAMNVDADRRIELKFLLVATAYSFLLPIRHILGPLDSLIFISIFMGYVFASLGTEGHEEELVGPAAWIHERVGTFARRAIVLTFLVFACIAIWFSAEPFADGLVSIGRACEIDEFILIQLVAPLASESPEFIVAIMFVLRGRPSMGLGTLISSKVNQWTLLIGTLPIVYSISAGEVLAMPLDARQNEELFLTSAQSLFAIAVLANLRFSLLEASVLAVMFTAQWFFQSTEARIMFAWVYLILTVAILFGSKSTRQAMLELVTRRGKHAALTED